MKIDIKSNEDLNKSLIATLWAAMIIMYFSVRARSLSNERTTEQMELKDKPPKNRSHNPRVQGDKEKRSAKLKQSYLNRSEHSKLHRISPFHVDAMCCDMMWCGAVCACADKNAPIR